MRTILVPFYRNGRRRTVRLAPGERFSWYDYEDTEEGWVSESTTIYNDGGKIHREWIDRANDCDGRLDRSGESSWDGKTLNEYGFPDWKEISTSQRDYEAEAAGY